MSRKTSVDATDDHQTPKNLIRSQYKDIMVKVDEDVYYLDRLQLALKSEYFEKLFIEDYADKNCELIEIPVMDTDTFSAIVDIIYGAELDKVVNLNNYVSLLMAMDYLQMEIDIGRYEYLVEDLLYLKSPVNMDIFRLYHFVAGNVNYKDLLSVIFGYLSGNLRYVNDLDELLSIPFDHFFEIISIRDYKRSKMEQRNCSKICARWIYYDLENRLPHTISLVNAIKDRLELPFDIDQENLSVPLPTINEHLNEDTISRYFYKLLEYNGLICSNKAGVRGQERRTINYDRDSGNQLVSNSENQPESDFDNISESDSESQLGSDLESQHESNSENKLESDYENPLKSDSKNKTEKFLTNGNFCDIVVNVGEKKYKLHRSVLKSASGYFEEIFSAEYTELLAKCGGIPPLLSMDKEYFLNEIDQKTFDIIIHHIYSRKVQFSADVIVGLFKAAHMLRIGDLLKQCESWLMRKSNDVCAQDVIEILNFTHENVKYKNLNRVYLSKYVVDSWPEIGNLPQFADLFKAITVPEEISGCSRENKVYLFNNIDQTTFQLIINYIYRDKLDLNEDNVVQILKASEIFKMKELMEKCIDWLTRKQQPADLNSEDVIEVLRFGLRNTIYDVLITIYLVKYILQWPEIDDSLFCSFSYEFLESMLMSPNFYFDDPYRTLDICSKWINHDMENRYNLVPRVALAISRNGLVNCDDYIIESPADLKNCSQELIKSKLLKILSTTSVLPSAVFSSKEKKLKTEQPIFISSKEEGRTFSILNSSLDEITSLHICNYVDGFSEIAYSMSATMMNDNLFLICSIGEKSIFCVYNFSLKKLFSLASDPRIIASRNFFFNSRQEYTLLNCCNEIYCCVDDGEVLKYSFKLNRWRLFSEPQPDKYGLKLTSDGNILYRMYKVSQTQDIITNYIMEAYDVDQNSWISCPNVPILSHARNVRWGSDKDDIEYKLIFMNDFGFAVLFKEVLYLLKQNAERWQIMSSLPYDYTNVFKRHSIITQDDSGEMLYLLNNKLHRFSRLDQRWRLKKKMAFLEPEDSSECCKILPYGNIIAIHNPIIHTQLLQL